MSLVLDRTPALTRGERVPVAGAIPVYGARSSESWSPTSVRIRQLLASMAKPNQRARKILPHTMVTGSVTGAFPEAVLSPWAHSKTVGVLSIEPGDEEPWIGKNRRRGYLIDKRHTSGLTAAETKELEELQTAACHYVRTVAPLSFEVLEEFEARARQLGIPLPEEVAR